MDWIEYLQENEKVVWQGRPAPRCFTFRNWQHSIFGMVVLVMSLFWLSFGLRLGTEAQQIVYGLIPIPFLLAGIYLTVGHLLLARLEWEHVFYAVTDRRLIVVRGLFKRRVESAVLSEIIWFQLRPLGEQLGTVRVRFRDLEQKMTISCIEYPRQLTDLLEGVLSENGIEINPEASESLSR